ncbi:MAG: hypothetical protein ACYCQI_15085 [Gammaproteobacteria bacterium]
MKVLPKILLVALVASVSTTTALAENDAINKMVNANDHIVDFNKAIDQAKKSSHVNVEFPAFIPKPETGKKYFASLDENSPQYGFEYMINIDSTPDCHGVKYCNIGIISARKADHVEIVKDRKNKMITTPVMLADGIDAYFTPGHAMGDYFPANIQWVDGHTAYMISWLFGKTSDKNMRDFLVTMANSAKHPGSG